jgi:hypothetical protein
MGHRWNPAAGRVCFSFSGAFKTYTNPHGEGRPRRFPPNNERLRRDLGSSQPVEGGLGHPWAAYMSLKLFLLPVCFKFPLKDNSPNKCFGVAKVGGSPSSVFALNWQGAADPTYKEKLFLLFFDQGVWIIVQHSKGSSRSSGLLSVTSFICRDK